MVLFRTASLLFAALFAIAPAMRATAQGTRALIVVTSRASINGSGASAGCPLMDIVHPFDTFTQVGWRIDIASPRGGEAPVNPASVDTTEPRIRQYLRGDTLLKRLLKHTIPSADITPDAYDVIYFAGGHGALWDFLEDQSLGRAAGRIFGKRGILATVGEGAAVLLNTTRGDGTPLYSNARLTCSTDEELEAQGVLREMPYLLESSLRNGGAIHFKTPPFSPNTVVEHRLITGQNSASSPGVAQAVVAKRKELLSEK